MDILLPVILITVIVESITVKRLKKYPFQNIPDKENNNSREYQLKNVLHNKMYLRF